MIRVVITGPPTGTGMVPYVIDWWQQGRHQFVGLSRQPLLDACRKLKQFGLMDDTVVGLFDEGAYKDDWRLRTTVGYGARHTVMENDRRGPELSKYKPSPYGAGQPQDALKSEEAVMGPYREYPGGPLKNTDDPVMQEALIGDPPATPAEPPPPPHIPQARLGGTGQTLARPSKPEKPHHKRKRAKSAVRQGSR